MSFSSDINAVCAAWLDAGLPQKEIAPVAAALQRYDGIAAQAAGASAPDPCADLVAAVVAGDLPLVAAADAYAARTARSRVNPANGLLISDTFADICRREARRAVQAELGRIDWRAYAYGGDRLGGAVLAADLAPRRVEPKAPPSSIRPSVTGKSLRR